MESIDHMKKIGTINLSCGKPPYCGSSVWIQWQLVRGTSSAMDASWIFQRNIWDWWIRWMVAKSCTKRMVEVPKIMGCWPFSTGDLQPPRDQDLSSPREYDKSWPKVPPNFCGEIEFLWHPILENNKLNAQKCLPRKTVQELRCHYCLIPVLEGISKVPPFNFGLRLGEHMED